MSRRVPVKIAPEIISARDNIAPPRPAAELARRPWDRAMLRFLKVQRRRGKPVRWIAERLGLDLLRVVAMAVNLRLTLHTSYRGRSCKTPPPAGLEALGPQGEIVDEGLCRWIDADPQGPWAMCGRPALEGSAYCPRHRRRALAPRKSLIATNIAFAPRNKNTVKPGHDEEVSR